LLLYCYTFTSIAITINSLTEENFSHPVPVIIRIRVGGFVGRGVVIRAFWGTEILEQGNPILPAEINKLDMLNTSVEIDACKKLE
jgi:hypothetical protein